MSDHAALDALLQRSIDLHQALAGYLTRAAFDDTLHTELTLSTAKVALEHGVSVAVLVEAGHLSSANAVLRTQLEATVRSAWLLYVASDEWLAGYMEKAARNPMKDPGSAPGMDDMIRGIERKAAEGRAPVGVAPQLKVFKEGAWGPLNSFVHSGIHPTTLQATGYPLDGSLGTLMNANGLSIVSAMLIAVLSEDVDVANGIKDAQVSFLDCCPPPVSG
jgi:hypothetical protein